MSPHRRLIPSNRPARSTLCMALAAVVMASTPMWAQADETSGHEGRDAKPMASASKDHHSMPGMQHMEMSMTGDADYDFAANMRMHHQMAVDMSEAQLKKGKNPEMLRMAKDIIGAQKKEIAVLDRWLAAHKKPK